MKNFTLIRSKQDCETLIDYATQEKDDLQFKKLSIERRQRLATSSTIELEAELVSVAAEITAYESVINAFPDGEAKNTMISRKRKAEHKLFLLQERRGNYGAVSLLIKEFDVGCLDKQIEEADAFIAEVTQHMNTL